MIYSHRHDDWVTPSLWVRELLITGLTNILESWEENPGLDSPQIFSDLDVDDQRKALLAAVYYALDPREKLPHNAVMDAALWAVLQEATRFEDFEKSKVDADESLRFERYVTWNALNELNKDGWELCDVDECRLLEHADQEAWRIPLEVLIEALCNKDFDSYETVADASPSQMMAVEEGFGIPIGYFSEITIPSGKAMGKIERAYRKWLKENDESHSQWLSTSPSES